MTTDTHRARLLGQAHMFGGFAVTAARLAAALPPIPKSGNDSKHRRDVVFSAVHHAKLAAHTAFLALPELREP